MKKMLFIIDQLELKYFEFNPLVTDFWLIREFLSKGFDVFITTKEKLFIKNKKACAWVYKTYIENENILYPNNMLEFELEDIKTVFFRSDPPVDIDYINACYVLNYVDKTKTLIINSPDAILSKNEKLYVNEFDNISPENIVTSNSDDIKRFLYEKNEIIIKPLNRCFSSGVYYLNTEDKNINTIIQNVTNDYKTKVMVQEFLPQVNDGDKRVIFICGEFLDYSVKKAGVDDFKFNTHNLNGENFTCAKLEEKEKITCAKMTDKLIKDGVYLAGLDMIDGKIIEINITSPCFFIKEINKFNDIKLEKIIADKIENFIIKIKNQKPDVY